MVTEDGRELVIVEGKKIRTWGGWYRHDEVFVGGKCVGRIQYKRRPKRPLIECMTSHDASGCGVLGINLRWLACMCTKPSSSAPSVNTNDG